MTIRLLIGLFVFALGFGFGAATGPAQAGTDVRNDLLPYVDPLPGGMHTQPWFMDTFLNLREDAEEAAAEGKQLVIFWEQKGCPYCLEMHRVNLRIPEVVDYIRKNFSVIQLNMWGDREVTDFDGEVTTEKKLARKYRVQFTPTLQFFGAEAHLSPKKSGRDVAVWRLLGYWKPFHFLNSFVYVRENGFETEPSFQRWLQILAKKMQAEGKEVKLW
jgi:thioredoxin-related protein